MNQDTRFTDLNGRIYISRDYRSTIRQSIIEDRIHVSLIAFYLGFAGIYWLPIFSRTFILQLKIILYILLVVIGLLRLKVYSVKQYKIYLWLSVCAVSSFLAVSQTTPISAPSRTEFARKI